MGGGQSAGGVVRVVNDINNQQLIANAWLRLGSMTQNSQFTASFLGFLCD